MSTDKKLSRFQWSNIAHLRPRARLEALLDAPNARAAVAQVPATDLYFTIQEVGLADTTDFVQLASNEQFRAFVDLGGWKRDRLDPHDVLRWIRAARGDEPERFLAKVRALDVEVLESLLRHFTVLHDLEENPDVNPEGVTFETPEGRYLVEINAEGAELAAVRALVNDLIADNPLEAVRFLEATRWELPSELEETAYRFRAARLSDLGFPPPEAAAGLFTYVSPGEFPKAEKGSQGLQKAERVDYVQQAFAGLDQTERVNLLDELRELSNAALMAEAADPGNLEAIRAVGEKVRDYLALGLEQLTQAQPERATEIVREHTVRQIFQVGFSLTLELKFRADRLAKAPFARIGTLYLLLPQEAQAVAALRQPRPLRALPVEGAEPVPFRNRFELLQTAALLDRAEAQRSFFVSLLGTTEDAIRQTLATFGPDLDSVGLDRVLHAALAHAALEGVRRAEPLPESRFQALGEALFEGDPTTPALRAQTVERVRAVLTEGVSEPFVPEVCRLVDAGLDRLRLELGAAFLSERKVGQEMDVILPMLRQ